MFRNIDTCSIERTRIRTCSKNKEIQAHIDNNTKTQ